VRGLWLDAVLAAAFLAAMLVERIRAVDTIGARMPVALALSVLVAGGLALRRRAPLLGFAVSSAVLASEALFVRPNPISPYANLVGLYSLGLYATKKRAWWGPALVPIGAVAYFAGKHQLSLTTVVGVMFSWLLVWALAYSTARRRDDQHESQRLLRLQAIAEERARIARDLHDVVGHTVNLMVVQAGAARRVLDVNPGQTRELLSSVEDTGRGALAELDRVLGMLRRDSRAEPDRPDDPGLASLPDLVRRMAEAGVDVTVEVEVDHGQIPRSLNLSVYRIIQEALTNALKHGQATAVRVAVRRSGADLAIEVCDNGRGAPHGHAPGRGLVGIGERVALFGGTMTHGGGERGGFTISALLPLP